MTVKPHISTVSYLPAAGKRVRRGTAYHGSIGIGSSSGNSGGGSSSEVHPPPPSPPPPQAPLTARHRHERAGVLVAQVVGGAPHLRDGLKAHGQWQRRMSTASSSKDSRRDAVSRCGGPCPLPPSGAVCCSARQAAGPGTTGAQQPSTKAPAGRQRAAAARDTTAALLQIPVPTHPCCLSLALCK